MTAAQSPATEQQRWRARPVLAGTLRTVLLAVPLVASTAATYLLAQLLPDGSVRTWWGLSALLITAVVVATAVERVARRLLPIALLLKLSMIFPDRAPSRLKLARTAAVRTPTNELVWNGSATEPTSTADLVLNLVAALGSHDRRTRGHSERVRLLCDMLAEELKLDDDARDRLRWSALLHDVGKMHVSTAILNKPGRLDAPSSTGSSGTRPSVPSSRHRCCPGSASGATGSSTTTRSTTAPATRTARRGWTSPRPVG